MLLVFGPQTTGPTTDYLSQLRSMLLRSSQLRAFVGAINRLPELWNDLVAHDPRLQSISGSGILQQLVAWLADDVFRGDMKTMPNVLAMPLTVIIHVVQWLHFLENNPNRAEFSQLLEGARAGGVQGFCIGLLSAVAVASAKTEEEAITYSGVALRLATCVGAYIDLDRLECDTTVLAVRWNSAESHNRLMSAVKASPDVRITQFHTDGILVDNHARRTFPLYETLLMLASLCPSQQSRRFLRTSSRKTLASSPLVLRAVATL